MSIPDRIKQRISVEEDGCWLWTGAVGKGGYGNTYYEGHYVNIHRLIYLLEVGEIPKGRKVCHSCDNRLCVNPEHLYLATQKKNLDDMRLKQRHSHGEAHAEAIKKGWTPELRQRRAEQARARKEAENNARADAAGVPRDWKFCPHCEQWFPRTPEFWHRNAARSDGLKPYCKPCAIAKEIRRRQKSRVS